MASCAGRPGDLGVHEVFLPLLEIAWSGVKSPNLPSNDKLNLYSNYERNKLFTKHLKRQKESSG